MTNGPSMSLFLIVCKRKRSCREIRMKNKKRKNIKDNLTFVPKDTWWVDSSATTHISLTTQDCLWSLLPSDDERFIFVSNGNKVVIEAIETFILQLKIRFLLDLFETFFHGQNWFFLFFGNNKVRLYQNSNVVGSDSLIDNLYMVDVVSSYNEILQTSSRGVERAKDVLELIHTNICSPFPITSWNGQQYIITFIDDYSRHGCLYLIHEKLKLNFNLERKLKLSNLIVVVNTMYRIVLHYTMLGKPSMSGVVEQQNQTLNNMVRRCQVKQLTRLLMNFGLAKRQTSNTCTFGVLYFVGYAERSRGYKFYDLTSRSFFETEDLYFVGYVECSQGYKFYDPTSRSFFEMEYARFIEEIEFEKKENIRNVVFEDESVMTLVKTIGISSNYLKDSKGNIERYKARLIAKGFTQNEDIDYKETFSPISSKDSFRTIMTLVVHFELEFHQMVVKTMFLNGEIDKKIYMMQPKNFMSEVDRCFDNIIDGMQTKEIHLWSKTSFSSMVSQISSSHYLIRFQEECS
ncbi:Copia protein, partial [Mucuna pruriens]